MSNETKELANKHNGVTLLVKSLNYDSDKVSTILGIDSERAALIDEWVECEGSSAEAISAFTADLKNINEVAYAFYHFGKYTASLANFDLSGQ